MADQPNEQSNNPAQLPNQRPVPNPAAEKYAVADIPYHTHNNTDSVFISPRNLSAGTAIAIGASSPIVVSNTGVTSLVAGTNVVLTPSTGTGAVTISSNVQKFGGTGTAGALSISSGTTTVSLGGSAIYLQNYSSISITGTGALAFTNPGANGTIIILKSQGNVTITSSSVPAIDVSNCGGAGGSGSSSAGSGTASGGGGGAGTKNPGLNGIAGNQTDGNAAQGGGYGIGIVKVSGGGAYANATVGGIGATSPGYTGEAVPYNKTVNVACGGGGGGGGKGASGTPGSGGIGGGGLYIECAGALNITSTINAKGQKGNDGSGNSGSGGGGGGGSIGILYNTLTANSGTYNVTAGGGGLDSGSIKGGGAGGDGHSFAQQNTELV